MSLVRTSKSKMNFSSVAIAIAVLLVITSKVEKEVTLRKVRQSQFRLGQVRFSQARFIKRQLNTPSIIAPHRELSCDSEVCEFSVTLRIEKNVSGFDVAMNLSTKVKVFKTSGNKTIIFITYIFNYLRLDFIFTLNLLKLKNYEFLCRICKHVVRLFLVIKQLN